MNTVTITGNLGQDPELRFTPTGKAVVNGSIGDTPRRLNRDTNTWEDAGETLWLRFSLWNNAEAFTEAARKGSKVIATGRLKARSWTDKQTSQQRTVIELDAETIAIVPKNSAQPQQQGGGWSGSQQADPWSTSSAPTGGAGNSYDEPPF